MMITVPLIDENNHSDGPVIGFNAGIFVQWVDGGRILITRFLTARKETFDLWDAWIRELLSVWPPDRPFCVLYDIRSPQFEWTLDVGTKIRQLNDAVPDIHGYSAIVYAHRPRQSVFATLLRWVRAPEKLTREYFTDYDQAISWLQTQSAAKKSIS